MSRMHFTLQLVCVLLVALIYQTSAAGLSEKQHLEKEKMQAKALVDNNKSDEDDSDDGEWWEDDDERSNAKHQKEKKHEALATKDDESDSDSEDGYWKRAMKGSPSHQRPSKLTAKDDESESDDDDEDSDDEYDKKMSRATKNKKSKTHQNAKDEMTDDIDPADVEEINAFCQFWVENYEEGDLPFPVEEDGEKSRGDVKKFKESLLMLNKAGKMIKHLNKHTKDDDESDSDSEWDDDKRAKKGSKSSHKLKKMTTKEEDEISVEEVNEFCQFWVDNYEEGDLPGPGRLMKKVAGNFGRILGGFKLF